MGRHMGIKILAVLLCVLSVTGCVISGLGIVLLESQNFYHQTPQERLESETYQNAVLYGDDLSRAYQEKYLTEVPPELKQELAHQFGYRTYQDILEDPVLGTRVFYTLRDSDGKTVASNMDRMPAAQAEELMEVVSSCLLHKIVFKPCRGPEINTDPTQFTGGAYTEPDIQATQQIDPAVGELPEDADWIERQYYQFSEGMYMKYEYPYQEYQLTMRVDRSFFEPNVDNMEYKLVMMLYPMRYQLITAAGILGLVSLGLLVYLGWAAGISPRDRKVRLVGMNRLPLDIFLVGAGLAICGLVTLSIYLAEPLLYSSGSLQKFLEQPPLMLAGVCIAGAVLVFLLFYCSFMAQVKTPGGIWWRHSLIGRLLLLAGRYLGKLFRFLGSLVRMLPVIWQWMLVGGGMVLLMFFAGTLFWEAPGLLILATVIAIALVCYCGYALGTVASGIRRMAAGSLDQPINPRFLTGGFRDMALGLNSLANVAEAAAREQMKSERMKAELITNVSHDIKTPLTSIINYVDLLQAASTPEEQAKCIEVLTRQSQRMKKLLEDLLEMSKASSGNIQTCIQRVDAAESVSQALGEFSDKLEGAGLNTMFTPPETPVYMLADGRLAWRVMSNVLSNAVKYAMPGTRLYLDILTDDRSVVISIKNISRESLNVSADELMERFVRGDASRNTEGSGLGLNIAKSLMDLQHGRLQLFIDGDLFKVLLIFPKA